MVAVSFIDGGNQRKLQTCKSPDKLYNNVVHLTMSRIQTHNVSDDVIGTDCIGNCKSNYPTIMTMAALIRYNKLLILIRLTLDF